MIASEAAPCLLSGQSLLMCPLMPQRKQPSTLGAPLKVGTGGCLFCCVLADCFPFRCEGWLVCFCCFFEDCFCCFFEDCFCCFFEGPSSVLDTTEAYFFCLLTAWKSSAMSALLTTSFMVVILFVSNLIQKSQKPRRSLSLNFLALSSSVGTKFGEKQDSRLNLASYSSTVRSPCTQ